MSTRRFDVLTRVENLANLRQQHWAIRKNILATVKRDVLAQAPADPGYRYSMLATDVLAVRLTRLSPQRMDDDNLVAALKPVRDGVAEWLGLDDGDARVRFFCYQGKGENVLLAPTGRRKRPLRLNRVQIEVRHVDVHPGLANAEDLRIAAEVAVLRYEAVERFEREARKAGGAVADVAAWLNGD